SGYSWEEKFCLLTALIDCPRRRSLHEQSKKWGSILPSSTFVESTGLRRWKIGEGSGWILHHLPPVSGSSRHTDPAGLTRPTKGRRIQFFLSAHYTLRSHGKPAPHHAKPGRVGAPGKPGQCTPNSLRSPWLKPKAAYFIQLSKIELLHQAPEGQNVSKHNIK